MKIRQNWFEKLLEELDPGIPYAIAFLGVVITAIVFFVMRNSALDRFRQQFEQESRLGTSAIIDLLKERTNHIDSIKRYFESSTEVTRYDFHKFVSPMVRENSTVQCLGWAPRIVRKNKEIFEEYMRNQGNYEFLILEYDEAGMLRPATQKEYYTPISFIEPEGIYAGAIGLDLSSLPQLRVVLEDAAKSGSLVCSEPIPLLYESKNKSGFIVVSPVFNQMFVEWKSTNLLADPNLPLEGFVFCLVQFEKLMSSAFAALWMEGLTVRLYDATKDPKEPALVCQWDKNGGIGYVKTKVSGKAIKYNADFHFASRKWILEVVADTPYIKTHIERYYLLIPPTGLLITLLVFYYIRSLIYLRDRAEKIANEKTAALQARESMFSGITQAANDGIILTNNDGKIIFINPAACELFGFPGDELLNRKFTDFIPVDETGEKIKTVVSNILKIGEKAATKESFESWIQNKNGVQIPVEISLSAVMLDGKWSLVVIIRNITERKNAQEKLQRERLLLRTLIDNLPVIIYAKDQYARKTIANKEDVKIAGAKDESEIIGKDDFELYPRELAEKYYADDMTVIKEGKPVINREELVIEKSGKQRWILTTKIPLKDQDGKIIGLVGFGLDFTERKKEEDLVKRERILLRTVIDHLPNTIYVKDREGRKKLANRAELQMMGCKTEEEAIGKTDFDIYPREIAEKFFEDDMTVIEQGKPVINREEIIIDREGNKKWWLTSKIPLRDEHGNIIGLVGIGQDITERKNAEQEIKKAKEAAEAANRAKSEFLANVSHEIRTPMNGIIGMTGLLLETNLTKEQRDYAETIRNCSESLLQILNDILDFSKVEAGKLELEELDFNLYSAIEDTADLMAFKAHEKGLEFISFIEPDVPQWLKGDPGRLRQIIINLVGNGIKFTQKGEVSIHVSKVKQENDTVTLRFEITDTGIGIPEDKIGLLFQPFSQIDSSTTRRFGGTGLGLSISKRLVEMMNGETGVRSQVGIGSTFWFTAIFKVLKEPLVNGLPAIDILKGRRALIVDDNPTNRQLLSKLLSNWGCIHEEVASADAALKRLRETVAEGNPFEIVMLDMNMPEITGEELGQIIKSDTALSKTHLIMLTSVNQRGDLERLRKIGFDGYLTKPIRQVHLLQMLANIFAPQSQQGKMDIEHTKDTSTQLRRRKYRILVAEDNITNQRVTLKMLEKLGYHADAVANGLEAIKALTEIPYDLVLMDCQMPEMDGYEATRVIRNPESPVKNHQIIVIAMTAHAMEGEREKCLLSGMNDYISKPVTMRDLEKMLERWLPEKSEDAAKKDSVPQQSEIGVSKEEFDPNFLVEKMMLDEDTARVILQSYIKDTENQIDNLRKGINEKNWADVTRIAHSMKGASANVGAYLLKEIAAAMEKSFKEGNITAGVEHYKIFKEKFVAVKNTVNQKFNREIK